MGYRKAQIQEIARFGVFNGKTPKPNNYFREHFRFVVKAPRKLKKAVKSSYQRRYANSDSVYLVSMTGRFTKYQRKMLYGLCCVYAYYLTSRINAGLIVQKYIRFRPHSKTSYEVYIHDKGRLRTQTQED